MFFDGQVCQETVYVIFGKFAGMASIVKVNVSANPVDVGFLRSPTVVPNAENFDHMVVQPGRRLVGEQTQR
jgi:hypothetical protein